jgi:hypothetical protein
VKLNAIKKALHIEPSQVIHRTPGAMIRQTHPERALPLSRTKMVHPDDTATTLLVDALDSVS